MLARSDSVNEELLQRVAAFNTLPFRQVARRNENRFIARWPFGNFPKSTSTWTGAQSDGGMALARPPIGPTNWPLVRPPTIVRLTVSVRRGRCNLTHQPPQCRTDINSQSPAEIAAEPRSLSICEQQQNENETFTHSPTNILKFVRP